MADNKLYRVTVSYEYYAYAESEQEAESLASETTDFIEESAKAVAVRYGDEPLAEGWNRDSDVVNDDRRTYYDADEPPMTLGALLDLLPKRGDK